MDKYFAVAKSMTSILQPKMAIAGLTGNLQNKEGFAAGHVRNLPVPGAVDDTGLKVLLGKVANQGQVELNGANYMVKGHAKSKGRKKSAGGKKAGKKAPSKSKGRKNSAAPKKGKKGAAIPK